MLNITSMKIADRISKYLFYLLVFIPIVFGGNTKELFEFPKTTALYVVGGLIILLFFLTIPNRRTRFLVPTIPVILFVAINIASSIFSTHGYTSLWGYYSRFNGGLISTMVLFGLYIVVINNKELYKDLVVDIPILTVLPISMYAIFQHLRGVERVYSTLGQPNWLAAYMVMIIPLIINRYSKGDKKMLAFYVLAFSSLWFTYSLSGLVGFLAACVAVYLQSRPFPKKSLAVLVSITLLIALTNPGIFRQKISDLWLDIRTQLSIIREAQAAEEHTLSDPGFIRFAAWRGTLDLITSEPKTFLIGTGPQTFPYEFQKYRPKELNYSSEWDFIINRPHNYYLELASEIGVTGLIIYGLVLWKNRKGFFFPSIAGYAVTNMFGWPVVPTAVLFWLWTAYALDDQKSIEIKTIKLAKLVPIALTLVLLIKARDHYSADSNFVTSLARFRESKLEVSLRYANRAIQKNQNEPNYFKQRARIYAAMSAASPETKALVLEDLRKAVELNPKNLATRRDILSIYFFLAVGDLKLPESENNIDPAFLQIAESYFTDLKNEYPEDAGTLTDIAEYEKRLDLKGYNSTRDMVEALRPDLLNWHESFR